MIVCILVCKGKISLNILSLMASAMCIYFSICKRKTILSILTPSVIGVHLDQLVDHCVT
jgi:hypothetical protein